MEDKKRIEPFRQVEIEFLHGWMGNSVGSKRLFWQKTADELVKRGTAKLVEEPPVKPPDEPPVEKSLDEPPMNKMVESPPAKKGFSRKTL
jgi:hypothetical protein